jgi:2-dehydro-3-deoxy-D-arabinonate dehydratase
MQLCKLLLASGENRVGVIEADHVRYLNLSKIPGLHDLSDVLHADQPSELAHDLIDEKSPRLALEEVDLLAPIDRQEVWAAGVTYRRSQEARERESAGAARFYDLVYTAPRPELFFKAPAYRVSGPGDRVRIRRDSQWNVPEPELALVLSPRLKMVGYTIGNDMSSRDIEGENPLYLPQAKIYRGACALGPWITLAEAMPPLPEVEIRLTIDRAGARAFEGSTKLSQMARTLESLVEWLSKEIDFPQGVILMTGTGIVPPDSFSLASGDEISISISGIGTLTNRVE